MLDLLCLFLGDLMGLKSLLHFPIVSKLVHLTKANASTLETVSISVDN